ncbi:Ig domain-containing protein [Halobacteriovorax sp. HFRX-2_2]|uniref:Ig domain-containing protein n=1 Tax=unclassified Halobacteriovorax TaxID=2639665 RepID=UPI0037179CD1
MKTLKGKPSLHLILILLLIATSCVPDSLTKFKEDGASSDDASSSVGEVIDPPSEFVDDNGFPIDPSTIEIPTSVSYSNLHYIFAIGDEALINNNSANIVDYIEPSGSFGDYTIVGFEDEKTITSSTQNNFLDPITNAGFNYGSDLGLTYASTFDTNSKTGIIKLASTTTPIRKFTAAATNFNFYNPGAEAAQTITITSMPNISVQAPIPEELTLINDTSFNCTGTGIGTIPPASPAIGDVYLSAGTCYYNYDGTNTNTVAFPFAGPSYIGLELNSNAGFLANDAITSEGFMTANGAQGTITYKDETKTVYGIVSSGSIYPGDLIDNSIPFSNSEAIVQKVKYFYQPDSNIILKFVNNTAISSEEFIGYDNSTKIEVSPDLPSTLRLIKDVDSPLFGYIVDTSGAGDHALQEAKEYTVTISNDISTREFTFDIGVINPPENLSYSQLVAFKVKNLVQNFSTFSVGQRVSTSALPPLTEGATGIIKRILDIDGNEKYLIVQVISGEFAKDSSIDNYKDFLDEEAVIQTTPVSLTHVLKLNSTAAFTDVYLATQPALCMEFPAAPTNEYARAIVTGNPNEAGLSGYLFINQIKNPNDTASKRNFVASTSLISDCATATNYTIQEMWTPVMKATFSSVASLVSGMDLLTNSNNASLSLSAINTGDRTALLQSADGKPVTLPSPLTNPLSGSLPETFSSVRPYAANAATLTDYEALATFELQRGVESSLIATLPKGESITYSISPELPPGLTLDSETGYISGTPEVAAASKTFTMTAENILGTSSTSFDILIEDYFEVTLDIDSTPVFYGHKDGEGNIFNKCRIKKRDIISNPKGSASDIEDVVDIDCFFDVGERDIYTRDINLRAAVGPGMCHTLEYVPYSFFKRRPNKTTVNQIKYDAASRYIVQVTEGASSECVNATNLTFDAGDAGNLAQVSTFDTNAIYVNGVIFDGTLADLCTGNYFEGRSCDNGGFSYAVLSYSYNEEVLADDGSVATPSSCTNTVTPTSFSCGGNPRQCLDGAIVSEFGREGVNNGVVSQSVEAFNGVDKAYTPGSPIKRGGTSNLIVTNYMQSNSCHDGNTDYYAEGLLAHANSASMWDSPNTIVDPHMGANPFYTFNCYDQASDIQARINVHIRDWDTSFEVNNLDKAFVAGDWGMDNSGTDLFGDLVNGFQDWDDLNTGGNYSACGVSTAPTLNTANYVLLPITVWADGAGKSEMVVRVQGGLPKDYVYPGMDITINGDSYQVKDYDEYDIYLTLPLDTDYGAGTQIRANRLMEFPAYKFNDDV